MKIFVVTATSLCDAECPELARHLFYRTREEAEAAAQRFRERNRREADRHFPGEVPEGVFSTYEVVELAQG